MKKQLYLYAMAACTLWLAACTNEWKENALPTETLTLTVSDFPSFQESIQTRAVGNFDAGKTTWASGDKLLVSVSDSNGETQTATMTFNGSTWSTEPALKKTTDSYTVTAYYAPAYEWNNGALALMSGKTAGADEFLTVETNNANIDFSTAKRTYSRLRIACSSETNLSVSITDFTPAGSGTAPDSYTLTTDSKGNAYLYGTWTANSSLKVTYGNTSLVNKDKITASVPNTSYGVDASFTANVSNADAWNSIGDGTDNCPYVLLNADQLISLSNRNDSRNITEHFKLDADITLTASWEPITTADGYGSGNQFTGTFDGGGHTISGLEFDATESVAGFIRTIGTGGIVKNLKVENCEISTSGQICGGIVGNLYGGRIENCHIISGTIEGGSQTGGIAGFCGDGSIVACSNSAAIEVTNNNTGIGGIGGIVGSVTETTLTGCCYTGAVTSVAEISSVGGIVGSDDMSTLTFTACYFSAGPDNGYGTFVSAWTQNEIDAMNTALQEAGYDYQYKLENGKPVIKNP
nr:fimbrillin family protein [uncultured Bacteroides sp.]